MARRVLKGAMPANFTAILLELHRRVPGRALWGGLLWVAKQLNFLVLLSASLVFVVDLVRPFNRSGCPSRVTQAYHSVINVVKTIEQFQLQHKDRCPRDLDEMRTVGVVLRYPEDPWGRPFVLECSHTGIRVCSHGSDETDPDDDVCHEEGHYLPLPGPVVGPVQAARPEPPKERRQ